jgi:hypothetical protein
MALPSAGPTDCSSGLSARIFNNFRYDNPWQASQGGVAVGTLVCPTTPNGFGYQVHAITTGITAGGEPTWPIILTNTVVDGGVTWTCQDVANPTGKAHPPAGYFGYVFTSADLDGFRLLAYNQAKAICDELAADYCAAEYNTVAGQSLTSGAITIINYGTSVKDTDSAVATGASWHFTCPTGKGGDYVVAANIAFSAAPGTSPALLLFKNGARASDLWNCAHSAAYGAGMCIPGSAGITLAAGDTLDVRGLQNSGGAVTLATNAFQNRITINRILGS